jgi:primosomal protein N' (replication factor Y)
MIRLVIRGPAEQQADEFAAHLAQRLAAAVHECLPQARVLGPAPAPFAKLRGMYRFQIHLQGPDGDALRRAVAAATAGLKPPEGLQWIADVDPIDML